MFSRLSDWVAPHLYAPCYGLHYQILFQSPPTTPVAAASSPTSISTSGITLSNASDMRLTAAGRGVIAAPKSLLIGFTLPRHHYELGEPRPEQAGKAGKAGNAGAASSIFHPRHRLLLWTLVRNSRSHDPMRRANYAVLGRLGSQVSRRSDDSASRIANGVVW